MKKRWTKALCAAAALLCAGAIGVGIGVLQGTTAKAAQIDDVVGTKRYIISNPDGKWIGIRGGRTRPLRTCTAK